MTRSLRFSAAAPARRRVLQGAAALVAFAAAAPRVWATADGAAAPSTAFLDAFCDTVIPPTDTAGASEAGVPALIQLMGRSSTAPEAPAFDALQHALEAELDRRAGARFSTLSLADRVKVLGPLDDEVMRAPPDKAKPYAGAYRQLKALTVFGYYTSEVGGSKELRYELVPGRYDPDIPLDPKARPFSNG